MSGFRNRRGALGVLLIAAAWAAFAILPLATLIIQGFESEITLLRAGEFIDEILPQTYLCLDEVALANGGTPAAPAVVDQFVRNRAAATLPAILAGRLRIEQVRLDYQPGDLPVVYCTVRVTPSLGSPVTLTRSAKLLKLSA